MKKNLRLLCLGLAAATFTCGFAQEAQDYTDKLQNADMELAAKGWGFDGEQLLTKNSKDPVAKPGFYGVNKGVVEAWNGNLSPLGDGYMMQRLSGLPNGTYVFGAYAGASKQTHRKQIMKDGKAVAGQHEYWSNRDSINGVVLFANKAIVPVATNNPDWNSMFEESHTAKFNVAVTLTEEDEKKGYLDVGIRYTNTNANYVIWDNATLYYFGDMSEADALDAMAKIDIEAALAVADTLKDTYINVDTLAALNAMLEEVGKAEVTAANQWEMTEKVFWVAGQARKSALDYANLKKHIESATVVRGGTWSADNDVYLALLDKILKEAQSVYNAKAANREEITDVRKQLTWAVGDVKYDSVFTASMYLKGFLDTVRVNKPGGCTKVQHEQLLALQAELTDTIAAYDAEIELELEDRTVNPNDLFPYVARVYEAVEEVKNNPFDGVAVWSKILPQSESAINGYTPLDGSVQCDLGYEYNSPLLEFDKTTEALRLTISKVASGAQIYFCISSLEFFDADGNEIPLTAENFVSNADHNSVAGFNDGQSYPGLVDDDPATYFHSDWSGTVTDPHYLEVVLPNGGYDAVSFKMVSRGEPQRHQFPAEIIVTTFTPEKGLIALTQQLDAAKALGAYTLPEPGYTEATFDYVTDAIAKAEALLANEDALDSEKAAMATELEEVINRYNSEPDLKKTTVIMPEAGKEYRFVSAYTEYYNKQYVEKALTVNAADTTLWWGDVCADSLQQLFTLEPIMQDGEPYVKVNTGENEDGTIWSEVLYCYRMQNVATGFYVDSAFKDNKIHLLEAEEVVGDTVMLKSLGRGQWNIIVNGGTFHTGDHNGGNPGTGTGAYGGTWGIGSGIVSWPGDIDGASAWYIREMPELPLTVLVESAEFESDYIRFDAANTITLTADKACAFAGLALYDSYHNAIEVDTVMVSGAVATVVTPNNIVACSFAFANAEGVESVVFNAEAVDYTPILAPLETAYEEALATAPVVGDSIGQYSDISAFTAAMEAAVELLENGTDDVEAVEAAVKAISDAKATLKPNMPEAGKYYFIYNAVEAFEKNKGYQMTLYTDFSDLKWGHENYVDWTRYWQFEPATKEDLEAANVDSANVVKYLEMGCAFFIKNVANEMYIAEGNGSMVDDKEAALPYVINALGGSQVSMDGLGQSGKRLHANNHLSGAGNGSNIIYWNSGYNTASAWHIVETQYDVTDIDFAEVETEKAVVKGTYDLFGRRVVAPTAPGIYIIDGRKKLVK